jgi:hypothetical protein
VTRLVPLLTAEQKAALETAVRARVGLPFKHTGRSVRGVDCVGLIAVGLKEIGIDVQDRRAYNRAPNQFDELRETLAPTSGRACTSATRKPATCCSCSGTNTPATSAYSPTTEEP